MPQNKLRLSVDLSRPAGLIDFLSGKTVFQIGIGNRRTNGIRIRILVTDHPDNSLFGSVEHVFPLVSPSDNLRQKAAYKNLKPYADQNRAAQN